MNQQQQYDNEMKGVIFANKDRTKDSQPQGKGSCEIGGVEYWISAWTNTSKQGARYQSLMFQRKDEVHNDGMKQAQAAVTPDGGDPFSDEIPFMPMGYRSIA